jgi:hypothetical protein
VSDLCYTVQLGWAGTPDHAVSYGGWWPGKDSTSLPFGTCGIHGSWDMGRYVACPQCSTAAAPMQFRVYPDLPMPPPVLEVGFVGEEKPYRCPVCMGTMKVPRGFYAGFAYSTDTDTEECRACESGIVWHS